MFRAKVWPATFGSSRGGTHYTHSFTYNKVLLSVKPCMPFLFKLHIVYILRAFIRTLAVPHNWESPFHTHARSIVWPRQKALMDTHHQGRSQPHSPGWAIVQLSSFFPHISIEHSYFSSNIPSFRPHFGPPGGRLAHPGRPWLRHCTPLNGVPILYCTKWHPKLLRFLGYKATVFFNSWISLKIIILGNLWGGKKK